MTALVAIFFAGFLFVGLVGLVVGYFLGKTRD